MFDEQYKEMLKEILVTQDEYEFNNEVKSQRFIEKVLKLAKDKYSNEGYYHKYEDFEEFLLTSTVDGIAFDVYEGEYGDY